MSSATNNDPATFICDPPGSGSGSAGYATCDRRTAYRLYRQLVAAVEENSAPVSHEIERARKMKAHPHAVVYWTSIDVGAAGGPTPEASALSADQVDPMSARPLRPHNVVYERAASVIDRLTKANEQQNLQVVARLVNASLQYQVALRDLYNLEYFIQKAVDKLSDTHARYDKLLSQQQQPQRGASGATQTKRGGSSAALVPTNFGGRGSADAASDSLGSQLVDLQEQLEAQKNVLQKFMNQVPFHTGLIRSENDFMRIYNGADDTERIHHFLSSPYVKMLLEKRAPRQLKQAFAQLKHHWSSFDQSVVNSRAKLDGCEYVPQDVGVVGAAIVGPGDEAYVGAAAIVDQNKATNDAVACTLNASVGRN